MKLVRQAIAVAVIALACAVGAGYAVTAGAKVNTGSGYVPIANCRIVDTASVGGKIPNGGTRTFIGTGFDFHKQGGSSMCTSIPDTATAISIRLTANGASANGAFVAYPYNQPTGQGTLYYAKGVNVTTGQIQQLAGKGGMGAFTIKNVSGPAYTIVDVNGYFIK